MATDRAGVHTHDRFEDMIHFYDYRIGLNETLVLNFKYQIWARAHLWFEDRYIFYPGTTSDGRI